MLALAACAGLQAAPNITEPLAPGDGDYQVGPEYKIAPDLTDQGNPKGKSFEFTMALADSRIFRGDDATLQPEKKPVRKERRIYVYVPAAYKDGAKAPLLVIHDGPGQLKLVRNALDNLTVSKNPNRRLPAFVAVAVQNGGNDGKKSERGLEYDTLSDRLARFINDEVLPAVLTNAEVKAAYPHLQFTADPWGRAVMGCSSGGAAALTMGWFRPDLFRRIIAYSGTFVAQQDEDSPEARQFPLGAWEYHSGMKLIETSERKPLRIFTHVSENDLRANEPEETHHNWVMAGQRTAAALKAKGYAHRFVFSLGTSHCDHRVFEQTLADTLVWVWRGYHGQALQLSLRDEYPSGRLRPLEIPQPVPTSGSPLDGVVATEMKTHGITGVGVGAAVVPKQPRIVGEWWQVAGDPDLGKLTSPKQQPVDFGVWPAADGTWQLWSCIRHTREQGHTRLFYRWEGVRLTEPAWKPMGIALRAEPTTGEQAGGLQAPFVLRAGTNYLMFYGGWNDICSAASVDGKTFARRTNSQGSVTLFGAPTGNTRDPMVIRIGERWHCYYTAHLNNRGAVYCRTSPDLQSWSEAQVVARGGQSGDGPYSSECPFVVELEPGQYYLFRNQVYGKEARCSVYFSQDPLDFGVEHDAGHFVCTLPIAAPEIIRHEGQYYIAALLPSLKGIQMARLRWE